MRRIFEIMSRHADEPEMDSTHYYNLEEVQEHFPTLSPLVEPSDFGRLSYTVGLHRIEITVSVEEEPHSNAPTVAQQDTTHYIW